MPSGSHRGHPWSIEEDKILLEYDRTEEFMEVLTARGFHRTVEAARSRKKTLAKKARGPASPDALARERVELEQEREALIRQLDRIERRLVQLRIEQVKDALGDIPVPEEILTAIRDRHR